VPYLLFLYKVQDSLDNHIKCTLLGVLILKEPNKNLIFNYIDQRGSVLQDLLTASQKCDAFLFLKKFPIRTFITSTLDIFVCKIFSFIFVITRILRLFAFI
jgi:hypothetical protein